MKRLPMTSELIAEIKAAVGSDVDPSGFAVFESISLNDLPLPGKDGTIFEKSRVSILTLRQMADSVNSGNHLPLMYNHNMEGVPLGRVFKAAISLAQDGSVELRTLFYIDETNADFAAKVDAGSLDEVSVQFLATQILCSECEFDYRGEDATWANFMDRTCNNGHAIGTDGVHARLVGLQTFTELSLVPRGAAKNPKILGKSDAKLAAPLQALAARGFEIDELFLTASKGEFEVDLTAILTQLEAKTTAAATAEVKLQAAEAKVGGLEAQLAEATTQVAELSARTPDANPEMEAELAEAKSLLVDIYTKLAVAVGDETAAPASIADLKDGIEAHRSKLTAMIPAGGSGANASNEATSKFDASRADAFKTNR